MAEYYDYVLALVPTALFGVSGGLFAAGASVVVAVAAASGVVLGIIGHATFVNAPGGGEGESESETPETDADSTAARPAVSGSPANAVSDDVRRGERIT
ncbi:hypothetical protein BRD10_03870 [Halobacteriales archaeon SW_12_71_31]|nr:MAG: hypothetical protein BRD10_03870 [Halobacteriales archaeon SW_12_71_31]